MGIKSVIGIRATLELMLKVRNLHHINSVWLFTDQKGNKITFEDMNAIILHKLEYIKHESKLSNQLNLNDISIQEDFCINRSFF